MWPYEYRVGDRCFEMVIKRNRSGVFQKRTPLNNGFIILAGNMLDPGKSVRVEVERLLFCGSGPRAKKLADINYTKQAIAVFIFFHANDFINVFRISIRTKCNLCAFHPMASI